MLKLAAKKIVLYQRDKNSRPQKVPTWVKITLERIAAGHPNNRIDELLPWSFKPPSS